ncbi:MAG: ABC transporter permease, partial [Gemmatimonadota bacterium]
MREPPRVLRALLRLFPAHHRNAFGQEMWEVVRYRWRKEGTGPWRRARLGLETGWDLLWSAACVWGRKRGGEMMDGWRGVGLDVRFVLRTLRRSPGYATTAMVVLAGAVAVCATVFSFVQGTLLHEPPYPDPGSVVVVWGSNPVDGQLRDVISGPNYIEMAREARSLSSIAAFHLDDAYLTGDGPPEIVSALEVTVDFLDVLGVRPALGRDFGEADRTSSAPATVIVSWAFWRDRLDADPAALGKALYVEEEPYTVIGVLPEGFEFVAPADLYAPIRDDILAADERYRIHYHVLGRLAPGATPAEATQELSGVMRRIARVHTGFEGWSVLVEPLHEVAVATVRPVIWTLTGVVGLVLLIALVNLATLFRIRTVGRGDELAVRVALGAGRGRVARVLALEAAGLAVVGALVGLAVTPWLLDGVTGILPTWVAIPDSAARVPVLRAVLDPGVAAVAAGSAVLGALVLTVPGFWAAARRSNPARERRTHRGVGGTRLLVAVELAMATVLCLGAGLTARSAARLLSTHPGLEARGLLVAWVGDVWDLGPEGRVTYFRDVVREVERVPGVRSAAVTGYPDFMAEDDFARVYFLDRALEPTTSLREQWRRVSEGLFETAGMHMRSGRSFRPEDFEGTPRVAVVNEAFARKHYRDSDPVGRFLSTHNDRYRE